MLNASNLLTPLLILALTPLCVSLVQRGLSKILRGRRLNRFETLARPASALVYVLGAQLAYENTLLPPKPAQWATHALFVLGVVLSLRLLRTTALIGIEWITERGDQMTEALGPLQEGFIPILKNVLNLFVFLAAAIMILKQFGYDVMSLLAALGVGSLAVGLAAKDTLSNMISGFTIMLDRNLVPGDHISIAGTTGKVEQIGLRSTRIVTGSGNVLIVPNSELVNTRILNLSLPGTSVAVSTSFKVHPSTDVERALRLCQETLRGLPHRVVDRDVWTHLSSLNDGALTLSAGLWITNPTQEGAVLSQFHREILTCFRNEGIVLAGLPTGSPP
jgi:MscS family membrane protein